ncbi:MAG: DUF2442 domain-containing protein [Oscillospiraceae bacterium]|jgi:hypothetical protein|nr:DUF2442 domain-containing protein [Oscillospiraceae bacterium]
MYIIDDIAYAGNNSPIIKVSGVKVLDDFKLWIRFNTRETKIFDFKPLLSTPAFAPLKNESLFKDVYIDYGVLNWLQGELDIAPEALYYEGVDAEKQVG